MKIISNLQKFLNIKFELLNSKNPQLWIKIMARKFSVILFSIFLFTYFSFFFHSTFSIYITNITLPTHNMEWKEKKIRKCIKSFSPLIFSRIFTSITSFIFSLWIFFCMFNKHENIEFENCSIFTINIYNWVWN